MSKPRGGTSYRLSAEAQDLLGRLAARLGVTRTSVLEMAIRKFARAELDEGAWGSVSAGEQGLRPAALERAGLAADDPQAPRAFPDASRLFCHALVQRLPEKGLQEALESLMEMVRFYSEPELVPDVTEPQRSVSARIVETVTAPVFPVTEE